LQYFWLNLVNYFLLHFYYFLAFKSSQNPANELIWPDLSAFWLLYIFCPLEVTVKIVTQKGILLQVLFLKISFFY